ncbi:MAG: protein kinase, partial [Phycisphaerales bacterium]
MTLEAGEHLGPYEIVAPLGAGGMGEVYRAKDTRLDREVAVKVLPAHLSGDPNALTRFEREAKAVAALSHPNILAIHDVGTAGRTSFVVMELLEGETLRERVRRSPIPWRKAVEYSIAMADGLAAAHAKGIIHRDLKPENIFLTKDGMVKILDFGLARMMPDTGAVPPEKQADTPTMTLDTRPGTVLGTVNYMSPEQISGRATDARTDVFSFGCVLYEMVTGSRAFMGKSVAETTTAILRDEPTPMADSGHVVPVELDREIARCLEKKPELRIQSARDLAFNLRDLLSDSGLSKPTAAYTAPRMRAMLGLQLIVGVVAIVALLLTLNVGGLRERLFAPATSESIDSLAILPFANAGNDPDTEYLCEGIPATIINSFSRLPHVRVVPWDTASHFKGREEPSSVLGRELSVAAVLTGRILARGDDLTILVELVNVEKEQRLWGDRYPRKLAHILEIEEEVAIRVAAALELELSAEDRARFPKQYTVAPDAHMAYLQGRFWWNKRTKQGFRRAIEFFDEAIRIDQSYALAYAGKASTYAIMGYYTHRPTEVTPLAREAAEAAIRLDPTLAEAYPPLGWVRALHDWDWEAAERDFRKAIELDPRYATAHHWYGCFLAVLGRIDESEREISRARELDPGSLIINREYATVAYFRRDFDVALARCHRAIEMDPTFAPAHKILGEIYVSLKRYDEAITAFHRAVELQGRSPRYAGLLGWVYGLAGRRDEALEELRILNELSAKGEYVPAAAFAMIYNGLGNFDLGFELLSKACDERDNELPFYKFGPNTDPLRGDPRFDALLKKMNLPPTPPAPVVASRLPIEATNGKIRLVVRPFADSSPAPQEWFCDGITEELINQLGRLHPEKLEVIGRGSSMHYKGSDKTTRQIGRELNVDYVLEGSTRRAGNRIRILVGLTQVSNEAELWREDYDDRSDVDVLDVQADVARRIAQSLAITLLPDQQGSLAKHPTASPEAYRLYLQGRFWWNKRTEEGLERAIDLFSRAVEKEPDYALAHAGIAESYVVLGTWGALSPHRAYPKAKAAAAKSLELDSRVAQAVAALGFVASHYEWNWMEAERRFLEAAQLDPGYASAHQWYAELLTIMGRYDEAEQEIQRALEVDPLSIIIHAAAGINAHCARKYDRAIEHYLQGLDLDPRFPVARCFLGV